MPNLIKIEPGTAFHIRLSFENGENFSIPYLELRFECPCATCVDEMTGKRTIKKASIKPDIKPMKIEPVGRYGVAITWSDGHSTGMYHFDRLYEFAKSHAALSH